MFRGNQNMQLCSIITTLAIHWQFLEYQIRKQWINAG